MGEMAGAICSRAAACRPAGASQISLSGESSASFCSVANTWNKTQPTEKVTHCATGTPAGSYREAACTYAGTSLVLRPLTHTRVPGGGICKAR
jgi:hypothetical protein